MNKLKRKHVVLLMSLLMLVYAACAAVVCADADMPLGEYWAADSQVAESLREYVTKVTNEADPENYIPVKDRIAVFDMDGTLTCETFFTYYDTMMFIDYCNTLLDENDSLSARDKRELKEVALSIDPDYKAGEALARDFARAYTGMTVKELYDYAVEFGQKETASFVNMRYIDGFYLPMVELVKYLYENDFTIYVVSGTERTTSRAIVANSPISEYVTPAHVIGSEFEIKLEGNEKTPSNMDYKYGEGGKDDALVYTGGFFQKNLNANKTIFIEREIGQRPVLAFGNSGSDTSMMNYALINNDYPAEAYMIVADDTEREWGKQDWDEKSQEYLEMGFVPVSMKHDFARIYPEGIEKAEVQYTAPEVDPEGETVNVEPAEEETPENEDGFDFGGLLDVLGISSILQDAGIADEDGSLVIGSYLEEMGVGQLLEEAGLTEASVSSAIDGLVSDLGIGGVLEGAGLTDEEGSFDLDGVLAGLGLDGLFAEEEKAEDAAEAEADADAAAEEEAASLADYAAFFPSWNLESESLKELVAFVEDCTDVSSPHYLEPEDRLAVFDMDGTILCEKAPVYIDYCLLLYRVLEDPAYQATDEERLAALEIREHAYTEGKTYHPKTLTKRDMIASTFTGMTPKEFRAYVNHFADNVDAVGFDGMTYGESFYLPMLEVMDFLRANEFEVYMVSACEREVVRGLMERFDFPSDHVIATDVPYVAAGRTDAPADEYNMSREEQIQLAAPMADEKCEQSNKPAAIAREIGRRPVLAFGNSSGDYSMLNYAESNPYHEGMGFLVVCDDTEREYGSDEKAAEYYDKVAGEGWTAISMAKDWATIYGEGVVKTQLPGTGEKTDAAA